MNDRFSQLLEIMRRLAKLLLCYVVAAWVLYLPLGLAMPALLAKGNPLPLVLALVLALPAPLLLSRRKGRHNPERLLKAWEDVDRGSGVRLGEFHQWVRQQQGLPVAESEAWEERLLEAWSALSGPLDRATAAHLGDLLNCRRELGPRELDLLRSLTPDLLNPVSLLQLWNRADASGLQPNHAVLAELIRRLPADRIPRRLKAVLPFLFRLARDGHEEARSLLRRFLAGRNLDPTQVPPDLRAPLSTPQPPEAGQRERLAVGVSHGAGQVVRRFVQGGRMLRQGLPEVGSAAGRGMAMVGIKGWKRWAALAGAAGLVLLLSRNLGRRPVEEPLPPVSPYDYAPPGNALEGFTLQIMSSRDSAGTARYVERVHDDNLYAYALAPRRNSSWYRVRLGWFASRVAADSVAKQLRLDGRIDEWYVANFDARGRMHETLTAPADSGRTEGAAGKQNPADGKE